MPTVLNAVLRLFIGIVIFMGLPIAGWGLGDIPGFMAHPIRLAYLLLALLLQILIVIAFPGVGKSQGKGKKAVPRQHWAVVLMAAFNGAIMAAAPFSDSRSLAVFKETDLIRYIGLGLFASGFILMPWAEAILGKQFSTEVVIQVDHQLVTHGPYRHLRHPRYLGIIAYTLGITLIFRSWLALILVLAMIPVLIWRIHDEETLLHREFGKDWEVYSQSSWRLIPFVY